MRPHSAVSRCLSVAGLALSLSAGWLAPAQAAHFSSLASGLTQEIYAGPFGMTEKPDIAWTAGGHLLLRFNSTIYEYDSATTVYNGTTLHTPVTTYSIPALAVGWGMASDGSGNLYANTTGGLVQVNLGSSSVTPLTANSGLFGLDVLASGKIAYAEKTTPNKLRLFNPSTLSNGIIYTAGSDFIDDVAQAPSGELVVVDMGSNRVDILTPDATETVWTKTNSFASAADGVTFWNGKLIISKTTGEVEMVNFSGPGLTGSPIYTVLASGGPSSFGDFAEVGPDNALYVLQNNFTRWDDGSVTANSSIVRIAAIPEPSSAALLGLGALLLWGGRQRQRGAQALAGRAS